MERRGKNSTGTVYDCLLKNGRCGSCYVLCFLCDVRELKGAACLSKDVSNYKVNRNHSRNCVDEVLINMFSTNGSC